MNTIGTMEILVTAVGDHNAVRKFGILLEQNVMDKLAPLCSVLVEPVDMNTTKIWISNMSYLSAKTVIDDVMYAVADAYGDTRISHGLIDIRRIDIHMKNIPFL